MIKTTAIELLTKWAKSCKKWNKSLASALSIKALDEYIQRYISGIDASRIVTDFEHNPELQKVVLDFWVNNHSAEGELPDYLVGWLKHNYESEKTFVQVFRRFRFQSFIHKNFKDVPVKEATAAYMNKDNQVLMAKMWLELISK